MAIHRPEGASTDAAQEPGPGMTCRRGGRCERGEVGGGEERELRRRLGLAAEDDFGTRGRVRGEDAVVAEHVTSLMVRIASDANVRRRDEGAEPRDEVEGVEQDGVGAVFPRSLEGEADAPVGMELGVSGSAGSAALGAPSSMLRKSRCRFARRRSERVSARMNAPRTSAHSRRS
jgi:hypothetical protein